MWKRSGDAFTNQGFGLITSINEKPEITMRWIDNLFDERLSLEVARGPFGTNLKENADGTISFMPTPEGLGYGQFRFQNCPGDAWPWAVMAEMYDKIGLPEGQQRKLKKHYPIYKPFLVEKTYPRVFFTPEQEEQLVTLRTDIHNYTDRMKARWIVGEEDVEAGWEEYLATLDRMGLPRMMEIYQAAYNTYLGQ
jgi:putative aldouronate transport system substrate-binding protein